MSPPFQASLVPAQSFTNSSDTLISFSVPMSAVKLQSGRQSLVWAFGAVNPNSANPAAHILQHRASGTTILDVLPDEPTASVSPTVSQTTGISKAAEPTLGPDVPKNDSVIVPQGRTSYQTMVIAHAVLGALFAMFLLPMGVLIARFGKSTTPIKPGEVSVHRWWFPAHAVWQGIIALAIGVAAVAVGYNLKKKRGGGDIDSTHRVSSLPWTYTDMSENRPGGAYPVNRSSHSRHLNPLASADSTHALDGTLVDQLCAHYSRSWADWSRLGSSLDGHAE